MVIIETLLKIGKFAFPKVYKKDFCPDIGKKSKKMLKKSFTKLPLYIHNL